MTSEEIPVAAEPPVSSACAKLKRDIADYPPALGALMPPSLACWPGSFPKLAVEVLLELIERVEKLEATS